MTAATLAGDYDRREDGMDVACMMYFLRLALPCEGDDNEPTPPDCFTFANYPGNAVA
jgi:hypothetical protein